MTTQEMIPAKVLGESDLGLEGRQAAVGTFSRQRPGKVVAEHEAGPFSERTKAALAAAKARGLKLGSAQPGD